MDDQSNSSSLKPVKILFSVIGVDGKPLEGARIRLSRKGDSTTSELYTDLYTDKDGKAITESGNLMMVYYTLTHGYYNASGTGGIGESDRYFTISFEGFKLLSASFECPGIPDDMQMKLLLCERVFYKSGFLFHPLKLTLDLEKNNESGRWEAQMYVPIGDFCWTLGGEKMFYVAGEVSTKENTLLSKSLPMFYPVIFTAENIPLQRSHSVQLNYNGITVDSYKLDTDTYIPQGKYSCRVTNRITFVEFEVSNTTEKQYVHLDYAVLEKLVPLPITSACDPDKMSALKQLTVAPAGYSWSYGNFIQGYPINKALPVGKYDYSLGHSGPNSSIVTAVCGTVEIKEEVNNELFVDLSSWQKVTFRTEVEAKGLKVRLVDENSVCRALSQKTSDSFYAAPGTYTIYSSKTHPVKVVVGDSEPEIVILPPCDEGRSVSCTVNSVFGHNLLKARIKADYGPFHLDSVLGDMVADHAILGKQTFVVSADGYKTFTCEVDVRHKMDICILLLPE